MQAHRREVLTAALAMACPAGPLLADTGRVFTPEEFGAKGDGRTNDSVALARLAAAVNLYGGGMVEFRRTTYLVGAQGLGTGQYLFPAQELLAFAGCRYPLDLRGNGARLLCAPGLRYGVFDADGRPVNHPMPYLGSGLASPYRAMISVARCLGPVRVADFELAGCTDQLLIGGQYGDTGWQIPATGLLLTDNLGGEQVERLHSHHHPQDGLMIDGVDADTPAPRVVVDVVADANGRQGCSLVGGRGYRFTRCRFTRTGRGKVRSAPGAGLDIEAEGGKRIRNLSFVDCHFIDNMGCGMVADSGDSSTASFTACSFIGTTNWSAWPSKPGFGFDNCQFTGALVRVYGDPDPARAGRFTRCIFDDDPRHSPTGQVYGGTNASRPLADLANAKGMLFDRCEFSATHGGVLPWSTGAIYRDCTMTQTTQTFGFPRGRFEGHNTISGKVDLYGSTVAGTLVLNGVTQTGSG